MVWNQALSNFRVCLCTLFDLPSSSYFLLLLFFVIDLFFCWCAKWDTLVLFVFWWHLADTSWCPILFREDSPWPFSLSSHILPLLSCIFLLHCQGCSQLPRLHLALKLQPASIPQIITLVTTVVETERHSSGKTKSVFPEVTKCTWGVLLSTCGRGEGLCSLVSAGIRKRGGGSYRVKETQRHNSQVCGADFIWFLTQISWLQKAIVLIDRKIWI